MADIVNDDDTMKAGRAARKHCPACGRFMKKDEGGFRCILVGPDTYNGGEDHG